MTCKENKIRAIHVPVKAGSLRGVIRIIPRRAGIYAGKTTSSQLTVIFMGLWFRIALEIERQRTQKNDGQRREAIQPEHPMSDTAFTRQLTEETGGVKGRRDEWEKNGRCVDF